MITEFTERFKIIFHDLAAEYPWQVTENLEEIVVALTQQLPQEYRFHQGVAIHHTATIEQNVVMKGPGIICKNCFIGANAYLRGPFYFDEGVKIGAGCEIKQSILFSDTAVAHFNYVGNSIIGSRVNFEAGSVAANHFNERTDKRIRVIYRGELIDTHVNKFGALVGDDSKIGANAVLSPGTLLAKGSVVGRLQLVN